MALISNDAIGNYVVLTPLLTAITDVFAGARIDYFTGNRTRELTSEDERLHRVIPFLDASLSEPLPLDVPYDWVINVEQDWPARWLAGTLSAGCPHAVLSGPALGSSLRQDRTWPADDRSRLWQDREWIRPNLKEDHPSLKTDFIGEIFLRAVGFEGPVPAYRVPMKHPSARDYPDAWIATSASLTDKLWPSEKWVEFVRSVSRSGLRWGLLGAKPGPASASWKGDDASDALLALESVQDWRGSLTLPEVVGALHSVGKVVTLDNGILHLAAAARAQTVGLFRPGIHRLWCPPVPHIHPIIPSHSSDPVAAISVDQVMKAWQGIERGT